MLLQRVQESAWVYSDASRASAWRLDTQYDDAQPHDPQPHGHGRGCSSRGRAVASRPLNSDLSPMDAPAWSPISLAVQLSIRYRQTCEWNHLITAASFFLSKIHERNKMDGCFAVRIQNILNKFCIISDWSSRKSEALSICRAVCPATDSRGQVSQTFLFCLGHSRTASLMVAVHHHDAHNHMLMEAYT